MLPTRTSPIQTWAASHVGYVRARQEDVYAVQEINGHILLVVADGMGGHRAGQLAAHTAVTVLSEWLAGRYTGALTLHHLASAVAEATAHVIALGRVPGQEGAGTTLDAVILSPRSGTYWAAHVGDSRIYLVVEDEIRRLTTDHEDSEGRLTSCLGGGLWTPRVDYQVGQLAPGDILLLCTDGLFAHLRDDEILRIMQQRQKDPAEALVCAALDRGGTDNVTVVVAQYVGVRD